MPAASAKRRTKQYGLPVAAGTDNVAGAIRVAPANANRSMLIIQNAGANDGLIRFDSAVQGDGTDMVFAAGSGLVFDRENTCPEAEIWVGSALGTTFTFIEQVTQ